MEPHEEAIVPSRRLGRSLGINNVPFKACTQSCVYCQIGRTPAAKHERRPFLPPEAIFEAVRERLAQVGAGGSTVDYLTFVPNGEPALDREPGRAI